MFEMRARKSAEPGLGLIVQQRRAGAIERCTKTIDAFFIALRHEALQFGRIRVLRFADAPWRGHWTRREALQQLRLGRNGWRQRRQPIVGVHRSYSSRDERREVFSRAFGRSLFSDFNSSMRSFTVRMM